MKQAIFTFVGVALMMCPLFGQEGKFQIAGTVQTENGKLPNEEIWVSAMLTPRISADPKKFGTVVPPDFKPVNAHAQVDGEGKFQIQGLPAGEYMVCAQIVSRDLLNGCAWQIAQRVMVPEMSDRVALTLQKGHRVKIVVNDPKELRGKVKRQLSDSPYIEPELDLTLSADGGIYTQFAPVWEDEKETPREPNTMKYEALIPFERPVRMLLNSKVFAVQDEETKQPLSKEGKVKPITAARGNTESTYRLTLDAIQPEQGKKQ